MEQLAGEITDGTLIGKVNIDENPAVAQKFGVMSIPTVVVLKDGKEVARSVGFTSKDKLVSLLAQAK